LLYEKINLKILDKVSQNEMDESNKNLETFSSMPLIKNKNFINQTGEKYVR
tara:strand:- start:407 stop:559 length:153 start_codon:yes stop_codon:yes gene_type:complete